MKPPQWGGLVISFPLNFSSNFLRLFSKISLDFTTVLWLEAQAPSLLHVGLDSKYPSDDFCDNFSALPLMIICCSRDGQKKDKQT